MSDTFEIKENDTLPVLRATLVEAAGSAINLTGATVQFRMRARGSGALKVDAAAAVVTALAGVVEYTWLAGDTDTVGTYDAEWELTYIDGSRTVPTTGFFRVKVSPTLE